MARLETQEYTYFTTVRGMCRSCRRVVPARIYFQENEVWQQSLCPDCKCQPALISKNRDWYLANVLHTFPDHSPIEGSHPPKQGCPNDCGPCTWHASPCQLPVFSVTNACNLDCPICFTYNRPDQIYHMSVAEMEETIDWVISTAGPVDLVNVTGGEPTLHPQLLQLLQCCKRPEIGRITMNSNGLLLAKDYDLCRTLADLGVYVVLSFNTFDSQTSLQIHGEDIVEQKLRAIDNLTRAGVRMTLLNVMIRDVNEDAIEGIFDLMSQNNQILSLTVQTMTHTGQGGGKWMNRQHIPVDEATQIICKHSGGLLETSDFSSRPSAHPLCYQTCYMLKDKDALLPFARFAGKEQIQSWMGDSYLIRLGGEERIFQETINDLYARGENKQLKVFRGLIESLYPKDKQLDTFERQRIAETCVRTVYVHAHMDEDNFDCSRAMLCPDLVPAEPGRLIPACTYNLLYRMKDKRFHVDR